MGAAACITLYGCNRTLRRSWLVLDRSALANIDDSVIREITTTPTGRDFAIHYIIRNPTHRGPFTGAKTMNR